MAVNVVTAAELDALAPWVPWQQFRPWFRYQWAAGEHVSMIGPTGSGKTTLALELLDRRDFVVALGTKPKDPTLDQLVKRQGWQLTRAWPEGGVAGWFGHGGIRVRKVRMSDGSSRERAHVVLWPKYERVTDRQRQREVFDHALAEMFADTGWCVFADEVFYLAQTLGLADHLDNLWTQGRSIGLTLVAGTQRPAFVPRNMYSQATHLFLWGDNDEDNVRRVGGLGGLSNALVRAIVAGLPQHHVLYVNTRTRALARTRVVL